MTVEDINKPFVQVSELAKLDKELDELFAKYGMEMQTFEINSPDEVIYYVKKVK